MVNMMKSKFVVLILIISLGCTLFLFGCTPEEETLPQIESIKAKLDSTVNYSVGDTFDSTKITVTAVLDDETERNVETVAAIVFDTSDLLLDTQNVFTESGTYNLVINYSAFSTELEIVVSE
jgi:hypothetical protein